MDSIKNDIITWFLNDAIEDVIIILVSAIIAFVVYILLWLVLRRVIKSTFTGKIARSHEKFSQVTAKVTGSTVDGLFDCSDEYSYKIELEKRRDTVVSIVHTVLKVVIVIVWLFYILIAVGVNVAPLLAGASIIGVALGFGAQNIVKDTLAGFFIILENQIRIGDHVDLDAVGILRAKGVVERISMRYVMIRDREGDVHFINNGSIVQIVNRTLGFSKALIDFKVSIGSNIDRIIEIVNKVGQNQANDSAWHGIIQEPMHFKEVGDFIDDSVEVYVVGATIPGEQWNVADDYKRQLLRQLQDNGIFTTDKK